MNVLVVYAKPAKNHLLKLKDAFKKFEIKYRLKERNKLNKKNLTDIDIVIVLGGDGTFLQAAQYVGPQPIFGINSDPQTKEGFFMQCTIDNFEYFFKKIMNKKFKIKKLVRLDVKINNKKLPAPALNEVYIGTKQAYVTSRYVLKVNGKSEFQKSSGLLVATASGSHAWLKSAGGKHLKMNSNEIQYHPREPYIRRLTKPNLLGGAVKGKVTIINKHDDSIVVLDSVRKEYQTKFDDIVVVSKGTPLNYIDVK